MEGLLFFVIQLVMQALLGMAKLLCMLAILFGRLLAMLLPIVFRAAGALVMALVGLFAAHRRAPDQSWHQEPPRYPQRQASSRTLQRDGRSPSAPLSYRRRYTVDNFWRSGDR